MMVATGKMLSNINFLPEDNLQQNLKKLFQKNYQQ